MATKHLNKIFLSASIPSMERDKTFYDMADIIAIRDAVRALAAVVIPKAHLVWGGHPSITPLIRNVMERMSSDVKQHVTLYQSLFYEGLFPKDNDEFENIVTTKFQFNNEDESLKMLRSEMIIKNDFKVGIFIGGMEGIFQEYDIFRVNHPEALVLPVASTGGASKLLYDRISKIVDKRLENDYAYMALFRDLLADYLN